MLFFLRLGSVFLLFRFRTLLIAAGLLLLLAFGAMYHDSRPTGPPAPSTISAAYSGNWLGTVAYRQSDGSQQPTAIRLTIASPQSAVFGTPMGTVDVNSCHYKMTVSSVEKRALRFQTVGTEGHCNIAGGTIMANDDGTASIADGWLFSGTIHHQ